MHELLLDIDYTHRTSQTVWGKCWSSHLTLLLGPEDVLPADDNCFLPLPPTPTKVPHFKVTIFQFLDGVLEVVERNSAVV